MLFHSLEIIDDLHGSVESTHRRLIKEDAHVKRVTAKSSSCGKFLWPTDEQTDRQQR